jgi:hypothetical protein
MYTRKQHQRERRSGFTSIRLRRECRGIAGKSAGFTSTSIECKTEDRSDREEENIDYRVKSIRVLFLGRRRRSRGINRWRKEVPHGRTIPEVPGFGRIEKSAVTVVTMARYASYPCSIKKNILLFITFFLKKVVDGFI